MLYPEIDNPLKDNGITIQTFRVQMFMNLPPKCALNAEDLNSLTSTIIADTMKPLSK